MLQSAQDYGTSCQTFVDCLGAINATLSSAKYPIFLHMEYKSSQSNTGPFLDAVRDDLGCYALTNLGPHLSMHSGPHLTLLLAL